MVWDFWNWGVYDLFGGDVEMYVEELIFVYVVIFLVLYFFIFVGELYYVVWLVEFVLDLFGVYVGMNGVEMILC